MFQQNKTKKALFVWACFIKIDQHQRDERQLESGGLMDPPV